MGHSKGKSGMPGRCLVAAALVAAGGTAGVDGAPMPNDAGAVGYPSRPVRLVVPFAPGAGTDLTARTIALRLAPLLGQNVVVDNRPGAGGTVGVNLVVKTAPDGYTLSMITSSHAVNASVSTKPPYDLVRDLSPITQATVQISVLVIN